MSEQVIIRPYEGFQEQFVRSNVDFVIGGGAMSVGKTSAATMMVAAFAPTIASWLVGQWGIHAVGYYLAFMSLVSIVALLLTKETKSVDYTK